MEWPLFCLVVNRAKRFSDMIERLDVDPLKLIRLRQGEAYEGARTTCLHCREAHVCLAWLEMVPAGERPDFCPSLALFESVRRT